MDLVPEVMQKFKRFTSLYPSEDLSSPFQNILNTLHYLAAIIIPWFSILLKAYVKWLYQKTVVLDVNKTKFSKVR